VVVRNGEHYIRQKMESLLKLDYPKELLDITVVSDGSSDGTEEIVREFAKDGVELRVVPFGGKAAALNAVLPKVRGEIVLLTDVRQSVKSDCLMKLVRCFASDDVGVVSGQLRIRSGKTKGEFCVGLYWRYETWIRDNLSRLDSMFGATGPIYAIRRELTVPVPGDVLLDDVYLPLHAFFQGYRLVVEPEAVAYDYPTPVDLEFRRKVRTLAGNYQLLRYYPQLLSPANRMLGHYLSYKVGRLAMPFALLGLFAASFGLPDPVNRLLVSAQLWFYALAAVDSWVPERIVVKKLTSPAHTFVVMMIAALISISVFFVPARQLWKVTSEVKLTSAEELESAA